MTAVPQIPNTLGDARFLGVTTNEDSITAFAGGGQSSATAITGALTRVSTVASGNDSVKLPKIGLQTIYESKPGGINQIMIVRNDGANSMQVYGTTADTINSVATGTGVAVGAGKTAIFIVQSYVQSTGVGNWVMVLSA